MDKICRRGISIMPGLIILGIGLTVLGITLVVVPLVTPSALPKIKKGLKGANKWRKNNGLKTNKEYKELIKRAAEEECQ